MTEAEIHFRDVYDNAPCVFMTCSLDGTINSVNRVFYQWTGFSTEEVLGNKAFQELLKPGARFMYESHYAPLLHLKGEVEEVATELVCNNGAVLPVYFNAAVKHKTDNDAAYLFLTIFNLSERREYERQLLAAKQKIENEAQLLEVRVQQRTSELNKAKDLAEAAVRAKSEFLANISHEIRTLLNAILGMAHLANDTELNVIQQDYVQKIIVAGESMLRIVNDILDFTKIDAGKLTLDESIVDIQALAEKLIALYLPDSQKKNLFLQLNIFHGLPRYVIADELKIEQILTNYLSNAIKFTEFGGVILKIGMENDNETDCTIHFEVKDSGIGISDNEKVTLFQPFQQADASTTRKYGGTGLGLAICKQLAELMNGRVGLESQLGKGSAFRFSVQLQKIKSCALIGQHKEETSVNKKTSTKSSDVVRERAALLLSGKRVLVVEDNSFNREVTSALLKRVGANAICCSNGEEAIDSVATADYHCILMDIQMPVMDGFKATEAIRKLDKGKFLPIIALTANTNPESRLRCEQVGMDAFVTKPVEPAQLYDAIIASLPAENPEEKLNTLNTRSDDNAGSLYQVGLLTSMVGDDPDALKRFLKLFISTAQEGIEEMNSYFSTREFEKIRFVAHRIKSSSHAIGFHAFAEVCQALEEQEGQPDFVSQELPKLAGMLQRFESDSVKHIL